MLEATKRYLQFSADTIRKMIIDKIRRDNKIASGGFENSIDVYVGYSSREVLTLGIEAVSYAKYIESGRRPGAKQPPVQAIIKWLTQKRVISGNKKKMLGGKKYNQKKEINSLAWAIAKSIKKKGIRPYNWKQPFNNVIVSQPFIKGLKEALVQDAEIDISKYLKELDF